MNQRLIDLHLVGFCLFSFLTFNWSAEENLAVNNEENRVFISRNYRSDSSPLMFLKLAYLQLPSQSRFLGKYLFSEHQISVGQLSADSSSTETLYCLK